MADMLIKRQDVPELVGLINGLELGAPVAVDCETTGLFPYQTDVLRGVSIAFDAESFYLPVGYEGLGNLDKKSIQRIFGALKARAPFLVLHHGKFDFAFLRQLPPDEDGSVFFPFPEPHQWWDTKVAAWLIDENVSNGLKEQAAMHWGEDQREEQKQIKKLVRQKGWGGITAEETAPYAAKDAELTLRLYHLQKRLVSDTPTQEAVERELAIQGVLYRMQQTGILVNPELIEKMRFEAQEQVTAIELEFAPAVEGVPRRVDADLYAIPEKGVNINSPLQLAKYLYDDLGLAPPSKTPSGRRSTNRAALEVLEHEHPAVARLMQHRRLSKALSGYLVPLAERIGYDGRIHPTFNSTGTVTGRFSCMEPNLQTIPRADTLKGVRDVFIAESGFELWQYDLSAAEMRVIAGMADETVLIDALNEGKDMHAQLAEAVFGPEWTSLQRRYAKNVGYGFFYGLTSTKTAAKYISGPDGEEIAKRILDGLKKQYPRIYRLMNRTTRLAAKEGILPIGDAWPGRYRHFQSPGRRVFAYTGLNARVQGGIGELVKDVMLLAECDVNAIGARICLQVHDELVCEVPVGYGFAVQRVLQAALDDVNPFAMPMIFDASPWEKHD